MKILSFGEIIWDVYHDRRALGGAPLNFAIHCAARGGEAFMVSAVGDDVLGSEALDAIKSKKVSTEYIFKNSRPTGRCDVTLDENKVPSYSLMRDTAYDCIEMTDGDIAAISAAGFDAVCFGTLQDGQKKFLIGGEGILPTQAVDIARMDYQIGDAPCPAGIHTAQGVRKKLPVGVD